jgi:hypothetical protein
MHFRLVHAGLGVLDLDCDHGYVVQAYDLGHPEVREVRVPNALDDGTFDVTRFYGARAISLDIALKPHSGTGPSSPFIAAEAVLRDRLLAFTYPGIRPILVFSEHQDERVKQVLVRGSDSSIAVSQKNYNKLNVSWIAPRGALLGYDERCYNYGFSSATSDTQTLSVLNAGSAPAHWRSVLSGEAVRPRFICTTPDGMHTSVLQLDYESGPGDVVVIDSFSRTIQVNGVQTGYRYVNDLSEWFQIDPGICLLTVEHDTYTTEGYPFAYWQPSRYLNPTLGGPVSTADPGVLPNQFTLMFRTKGPAASGDAQQVIAGQFATAGQQSWMLRRVQATGAFIWSVSSSGTGTTQATTIPATGLPSDAYGPQQIPTIADVPNNEGASVQEGGMKVRFLRAGRVTGVRYTKRNASGETLVLRAWRDSDSTKVAEVSDTKIWPTPPFTEPIQTFTVTFPSPVLVAAGSTYTFTIGTTDFSGGTAGVPRNSALQAVTNTADMQWVEFRSGDVFNVYPPTVAPFSTYYAEPIFEANEGPPAEATALSVWLNDAGTTRFQPKRYNPTTLLWENVGSGTTATYTAPFDSNAAVYIGENGSTEPFNGAIYWVEMRTGLDPAGGNLLWRYGANDLPVQASPWDDTPDVDSNTDGIADGWQAYVVGSPTGGSRSIVAGRQRMSATLPAAARYGVQTATPRFAVQPSRPYTARARLSGTLPVQSNIVFDISWHTSVDVFISTATRTLTTITGTPTDYWLTATAPATAAKAQVTVHGLGVTASKRRYTAT